MRRRNARPRLAALGSPLRVGLILAVHLGLAAPAAAQNESSIKAGYVVNRNGAPGFTWLVIQESSYFVKGKISFGYEIQFSYDKTKGAVPAEDVGSFPLNVFFNSKIRLIRKGVARPFVGAGIGLLTAVKSFSDHYEWEKNSAAHLLVGVALGTEKKASFQIEARLLTASQTGFGARLLIVAGLSY
jgi:hypothetical protein